MNEVIHRIILKQVVVKLIISLIAFCNEIILILKYKIN